MKMIIAVDQNNAIGWSNGNLPWHSSEDLIRFKRLTSFRSHKLDSKPQIVMGLNTHLSIGRVLPDRENFVVTSNPAKILYDNNQLRAKQLSLSELNFPNNAWIIGGAQLYNYVLEKDLISQIYLTKVYFSSGADVKINFDLFNDKLENFNIISTESGSSNIIPNEPKITFHLLERR